MLSWHEVVDLMVISDLAQACTMEQTCASLSYDANTSLMNGQPSPANGQITDCDNIVVV